MRKQFDALLVLLVVLAAVPALAADRGHDFPRANQGVLPFAPERRDDPRAQPEIEYREGRANGSPTWSATTGTATTRRATSDTGSNSRSRTVASQRAVPRHRYEVVRIDRTLHRFWFPDGFFFDIAGLGLADLRRLVLGLRRRLRDLRRRGPRRLVPASTTSTRAPMSNVRYLGM
jgi:hypothetical protein